MCEQAKILYNNLSSIFFESIGSIRCCLRHCHAKRCVQTKRQRSVTPARDVCVCVCVCVCVFVTVTHEVCDSREILSGKKTIIKVYGTNFVPFLNASHRTGRLGFLPEKVSMLCLTSCSNEKRESVYCLVSCSARQHACNCSGRRG